MLNEILNPKNYPMKLSFSHKGTKYYRHYRWDNEGIILDGIKYKVEHSKNGDHEFFCLWLNSNCKLPNHKNLNSNGNNFCFVSLDDQREPEEILEVCLIGMLHEYNYHNKTEYLPKDVIIEKE